MIKQEILIKRQLLHWTSPIHDTLKMVLASPIERLGTPHDFNIDRVETGQSDNPYQEAGIFIFNGESQKPILRSFLLGSPSKLQAKGFSPA